MVDDTEIARVLALADKYQRYGMGLADIDDGWEVICDAANLIRALRDERDKIDRIASELMDTVHMQAQKLAATEAERDALRKSKESGTVNVGGVECKVTVLTGPAIPAGPFQMYGECKGITTARDAGPTPFQGRTTRRE